MKLFVCCGQSCKPALGSPVSLQLLSRSSRKFFSSVFACGWDRYLVSICERCPFAKVRLCSRISLFFYVILCWIQQEGKRQEESDADVEARQRMVRLSGFLLLCSVIGLKRPSRQLLDQSDTRPKHTRLGHTRFPPLYQSRVFALSAHWSSHCLCWF